MNKSFNEEITLWYTTYVDGNQKQRRSVNIESFDGIYIADFHRACKRFAELIGYTSKNIEDFFGEDKYNEDF